MDVVCCSLSAPNKAFYDPYEDATLKALLSMDTDTLKKQPQLDDETFLAQMLQIRGKLVLYWCNHG